MRDQAKLSCPSLLVLALLLLQTSCGHPLPADETPDDPLADACSLYCEQAIMCADVSSQYLEQWEVDTVTACEAACAQTTRDGAEVNGKPECVDLRVDLWTCAAMLETCEDFEWFEYSAFGMAGYFEMWCGDELDAVIGECS